MKALGRLSLCSNAVRIAPVLRSWKRNYGSVQLILGPMFSGKTTELVRRMQRYQVARQKTIIIKYINDGRYTEEARVATHTKQTWEALPCTKLADVENDILDGKYDCIGVDEGQFFPDVVSFSEKMANEGKTVIVAALDGTYQRKPFGSVLDLIPLAEKVTKLSAVCMECFAPAAFSKRLGDEKEVEVIGGTDKYMAVCRKCYFRQLT
eukprot:TRINITY_DN7315_c0_g1_i1.p1 TRINITY_DN7315_c0_g1~~TRINITY_DN7315_c0_g1_i1.p1  ORF type:complete len:215 (+),score=29.15 TRINITY_DN7315_c0_g1_i1:22-645(+)